MAERAKLRYKDLSFFDADLRKLCTHVCQASAWQFLDYKIDRSTQTVWYQYRCHNDIDMDCISFDELTQLRVPLSHEKPVIDYDFRGKKYVYYRKDIWELEDLFRDYFKITVNHYKLDNNSKSLYLYFGVGGEKFIGIGYDYIGDVRSALKSGLSYNDIKMKYRTWGNLDK